MFGLTFDHILMKYKTFINYLKILGVITKDPTGFPEGERDNFDVSFTGTTFTIEPKAPATQYEFYYKGRRFVKTAVETLNGDGTDFTLAEGLWHFYFDTDGVLQVTDTITEEIAFEIPYIANIYWDATNSKHILLGKEGHGTSMSADSHHYNHETRGTAWYQGLGINSLVVDGSGSLETEAQMGFGSGEIYDEDIGINISAIIAPGNISIFFQEGATGIWRKKDADDYPLVYSGTAGYVGGAGRIPYNLNTVGVRSLSEVAQNDFINMIYFATNDENQPIIGIQGQTKYLTLNEAREGITDELDSLEVQGLPFMEFKAIGAVIFQSAITASNTPKAWVRSLDGVSEYLDLTRTKGGGSGAVVNHHGSLSGLGDPDHPLDAILGLGGGGPTSLETLDKILNIAWSAGSVSGFGITENPDGTVDIAAGEATVRESDLDTAILNNYSVDAVASLAITDNSTVFIIVDYNSGSPIITTEASVANIQGTDSVPLYIISRVGTELAHVDIRKYQVDFISKILRKDFLVKGYEHVPGGTATSETGTRKLHITAGSFYIANKEITHPAYDTSGANSFDYIYTTDSGVTWTRTASQTTINNTQYNDITSGLVTLLNTSKYGVHWVYIVLNNPSRLKVVYGQDEYNNLSEAQAAGSPSLLPPELQPGSTGQLIAKVIIKKSDTNFTEIQSPFDLAFTATTPVNHNGLAGLQGGQADQYYHLNQAQYDIINGGGVEAKTSTGNILNTDRNKFITNEGAGGDIELTLPTAIAGLTYTFYVQEANNLKISANTGDTIRNAGTVSVSGGSFDNSTVGGLVKITAINATEWICETIVGTWTVT